MILLLGGTAETASLAGGLAEAGYMVLVSTATDIPLATGQHSRIRKRTGRLDGEGLAGLIRAEGVCCVVDATHPYAAAARQTALDVAVRLCIPYLTLIRPPVIGSGGEIVTAAGHGEAAVLAFSYGRPVLLTTGSKNLRPYVEASISHHLPLWVRVLPEEASLEACRRAGIEPAAIIAGRGPFSVAENRETIRRHGIGVLVMKDSGAAGGTKEKLAAASQEGCRVVVVRRPDPPATGVYTDPEALIAAVLALIPKAVHDENPPDLG